MSPCSQVKPFISNAQTWEHGDKYIPNPFDAALALAHALPSTPTHGRIFRKCAACGKQGWHPQASAEVCCGQRMTLIERPAMRVDDYVQFIHCPRSYASGAISRADVLDMMNKDGVQALPDNESTPSDDYQEFNNG